MFTKTQIARKELASKKCITKTQMVRTKERPRNKFLMEYLYALQVPTVYDLIKGGIVR